MSLFRRSRAEESPDRWVVIGLGNPGERYASTRHNAGAMALDVLLQRMGGRLKSHKSGCLVAEGRLADRQVTLARSTSYMNESGRPLAALMKFYKTPPDQLIVLHDELDIPFDDVRVKIGGGTAGHNGVKSIAQSLGTKDFVRVRIGVGRPNGGDAVGKVLGDFNASERKELPFVLERSADAAERVLEVGAERAMNEFNTRA